MDSLLGKSREKGEELSQRYRDIATSVQLMYEEAYFHILNSLYKRTGLKNVALAGGCLQNSLANGKIYDKTSFENVYIPPAANDAGGAIGAAFYLWHHILGKPRNFEMNSPYWGPQFSNEDIKIVLMREKANMNYKELDEDEINKKVVQELTKGKIIGWFQGRSELGPRTLGNRSILADPRRKEIKDILNARIKKREWFRPFAPVILKEKTESWFERGEEVSFMEKVYNIKEEKRELIPAVCHMDGTGRLQTISHEMNPKYYNLIKEFDRLTGVPILLNTSFNENEPIVNTPEEAVDCFLRTKMDILVMGNYYIS